MEKKVIRGREMYLGATTEEVISMFKAHPDIELETSSGITRWLRYDKWHSRIGITDNVAYDWYSLREFRRWYGSRIWHFFVM